MEKQNKIKGILFDYGGTLDTNGIHWAEVIWSAYIQCNVIIDKEAYREAYRFGERQLAIKPLILPKHDFKDVLDIKIKLQFDYLNKKDDYLAEKIAGICYEIARKNIIKVKSVLDNLIKIYPLVLVSNFYGNLETVLNGFGIRTYFKKIIESAVVGVRKPDPAIFKLGTEALQMNPAEVAVIGDSYSKDMEPAMKIGCITIWLKGKEWEESVKRTVEPDFIISDLSEVIDIMNKIKY